VEREGHRLRYDDRVGDTDGLHAAARRRRDRQAAKAAADGAKEAKRAIERVGAEKDVRKGQEREALAEAGKSGKAFTTIALCVGLFGPMALGIIFFDEDSFLTLGLTTIASMVGAFAAASAAEEILATMRRRRLFRIGRGFEPSAYLEALGEKRRRGVLVVRAKFTRAWPDDARDSARDAVLEWMPALAGIEWDGVTLVLRSAQLDGREWLSGGDGPSCHVFNNRLYHGAFLRIVEDVVPNLEKVAPIAALTAEIEGPVEAWDADADRI
jgi:hypothetical protein